MSSLTDSGRTATGTLFFDSEGRLTEFVARLYSGSKDLVRARHRLW